MLNILGRFFDSNEKEIKRITNTVSKINELEGNYEKLTDKQITQEASNLRKQVKEGKNLEEALPQTFALVREAFKRVIGVRLFDVQLVSAIALHEGKISEQKTGEGKTFSAVPALFLNSLAGKAVHLVTVNDYLARRECGWVGPVYNLLGAKCSTIIHDQAFVFDPEYKDDSHSDPRLWFLKPVPRQEAYLADITVGTNNEFGFDYLRDNMVRHRDRMVQRGHSFAIVDEVDSILIDEARTPLIISQPAQEPTKKYYEFAKIMGQLSPEHYLIDEKQRTAHLTEEGILKIEKILGIENLYEKEFSTLHHIEQALKARTLFQKDVHYVVKDNEVIIVDEFTGRLMPGRRYSEGLHQAIEAKEGVTIQQESQTLATISFQNYFRMYEKLAGMTGTAATEAEEFHKIYKLDVVSVPTHRQMIREDYPDVIYKTQIAKYNAVVDLISELHEKGQPVLVGTTSIEKNEYLSNLLKKRKVSHALLNAKNHEKEAEIIAEAGKVGSVTVATNMAGRGVDIKLGEGAEKLGGLYVVGTERHESRRIDNQLRGRSGRQGDPGASKFFVSLEDDLMRIFGGDQVAKVMNFLKIPEDQPIEHSMVSKALETAQIKVEGHNFDIRKHTVEYDDVMNQQRQIIYGIRLKALDASAEIGRDRPGLKEEVLKRIDEVIKKLVTTNTEEGVDTEKIAAEFVTIIPFDQASAQDIKNQLQSTPSVEEIESLLINISHQMYEEREKQLGPEIVREMEIFAFLNTIDTLWVEHLDNMDDLRTGIGLRSFGQREPLVEYKREAFEMFERLVQSIDHEIVYQIYKLTPSGYPTPQPQEVEERFPVLESGVKTEGEELKKISQGESIPQVLQTEGGTTKVTIERGGEVVSQQVLDSSGSIHNKQRPGRNDPCHCGSGKKYKRCHYPN